MTAIIGADTILKACAIRAAGVGEAMCGLLRAVSRRSSLPADSTRVVLVILGNQGVALEALTRIGLRPAFTNTGVPGRCGRWA